MQALRWTILKVQQNSRRKADVSYARATSRYIIIQPLNSGHSSISDPRSNTHLPNPPSQCENSYSLHLSYPGKKLPLEGGGNMSDSTLIRATEE
jgi:hypothetical protein